MENNMEIKKVIFLLSSLFIDNIYSRTYSKVFKNKGLEIRIEEGDITKSTSKVIVNAANKELKGGSGVCGAIFKAAGSKNLQKECDNFSSKKGVRCEIGKSVITNSYDLKANGVSKIIHAVGPDCRKITDKKKQDELLKSTYLSSLSLCLDKKYNSISYPFISSGKYAFPKDRASLIALKAILNNKKSSKKKPVVDKFDLADSSDYDLFVKNLKKM